MRCGRGHRRGIGCCGCSGCRPARRITLTGFGGQGKTALAQEAGRWLTRTGLFHAAVFVDYSRVQARDAVAVAVSNIGSVLGESLIDADAATTALMKLPPLPTVSTPAREALIALFDQVKFHPLSIRVLAQQLKTRSIAELGERLEQLLASGGSRSEEAPSSPSEGRQSLLTSAATGAGEDTPAGLLASLELSLDRLDEAARKVLPRLGVFQGGAFEDDLIAVTGLGDEAASRERIQAMLAALESGDPRRILRAVGLNLPDGLSIPPEAAAQLAPDRLRQQAAEFREMLVKLPPPTEASLWPSLRRQLEAAALIEAEDIPGVTVPFLRFHPTLAPMLWAQLGADDRTRLSAAHRQRCYAVSGYLYQNDARNPHQARAIAWRELPNLLHAVHAALDAGEPDAVEFADNVNLFVGTIFGLKQEAESLSMKAQTAAGEAGSRAWFLARSNRGEQLLAAGQVTEAAQVFRAILKQLGDAPSYNRAATLCRLGRCMVFAEARQWDEAERHYRESARINEDRDNLAGAAQTWNQLATISKNVGKPDVAEMWYRKAIEVDRAMGNPKELARALSNLANLLRTQPGQLAEARQLAEEALAIDRTLDPGAAEIWKTYGLLADIAEQEEFGVPPSGGGTGELASAQGLSSVPPAKAGTPNKARDYRRLAREAKRNFAGTRHELRRHAPFILGTVMAVRDRKQRRTLEEALPGLEQGGWTNLVATLRRILAGERDADALCESLDLEDSMIIETILAGLADPSSLSDLLPSEPSETS